MKSVTTVPIFATVVDPTTEEITYTIVFEARDTAGNLSDPKSRELVRNSSAACGQKALKVAQLHDIADAMGIQQLETMTEKDYYRLIAQNYPNPFDHSTIISFNNQQPGKVTLLVTDLEGKIFSLESKHFPVGDHQFRFKPSHEMSKGILFYKLITPSATFAGKMIWRH